MSEPETEVVYICVKCGRKATVLYGHVPGQCQYCGGVILKKVVVR